jgi:hypothetical protein
MRLVTHVPTIEVYRGPDQSPVMVAKRKPPGASIIPVISTTVIRDLSQ